LTGSHTSSWSQTSRLELSSSSYSPIPSRQARTIISVQPVTFFTMLGRASDRLIINSKALNLSVERSSRSSSSSIDSGVGSGSSVVVLGGGNMKAPCRPPPVGKGRPTVGVGPQSTAGSMREGRKDNRDWR